MADEILAQILRNQADAAVERKEQGANIAQMGSTLARLETVLLGPDNQPETGLLATVTRMKGRVGRLEKAFLGIFTVGGSGTAATAYWDSLKALIPGLGGHGG